MARGKTAGRRKVPAGSPAALLAIDIGNTQTVVGVFRNGDLEAFWRLSSRTSRTGDELTVFIGSLCHPYQDAIRASRRIAICSVVPMLTEEYEAMVARLYDATALVVTSETPSGVKLDVPDPASLGADRIANAAAVTDGALPAIVVDLGTATTFDVVGRGGRYLGGAIAPGIRTSADELYRRAAKLPKVEIRKPPRRIGRTTEESIQSGVYFGAVGAIDGIVRQLEAQLRRPARVVATGGLAALIAKGSQTIQEVDEALTLRGLVRIAELNRT
jgi:type III pantothenate kinase